MDDATADQISCGLGSSSNSIGGGLNTASSLPAQGDTDTVSAYVHEPYECREVSERAYMSKDKEVFHHSTSVIVSLSEDGTIQSSSYKES
ncbi:hypothetical protein MTO96_041878 [Rhipicephalus appendiculatus]